MDLPLYAPILAKALITWTPVTYYVAAGVVQCIVILVAFRLMSLDPEINTFVSGAIAAALINVGGYFLADMGLAGIIVSGVIVFGLVIFIAGGDAVRGCAVAGIVIATYFLLGSFIIPRTPLEVDDVGGLTRVVMTGGLKAEPIETPGDDDDDEPVVDESGNVNR